MDPGPDLEVLELVVDLLLFPFGLALPRQARPLLLLLELPGETGLVDRQGPLPGQLLRQVEREAEGVVEPEDLPARQDRVPLLAGLPDDLIEIPQARGQREGEPFLLGQADLGDVSGRGQELGVGVLHGVGHAADELEQERPVDADEVALPEGPADEPPQHVAPPVVGRGDAVADEEGRGPDVVGDDPERDVALVAGGILALGHPGGALDQGQEQVGVVIASFALDDRGHALEAHAGVDRRGRQRAHDAVLALVELHENEVPELDEPVAPLLDQRERIARLDRGAEVVVELGAGAAGPGIAHGPEVVLLAVAEDPVLRNAHFAGPEPVGLVVVEVDRRIEPLRGQAEDAR